MSNDPDDVMGSIMGVVIGLLFAFILLTAPIWVPYFLICHCLTHYCSVNVEEIFEANPMWSYGLLSVISVIQLIIYIKTPTLFKIIAGVSIILGIYLICNGYVN